MVFSGLFMYIITYPFGSCLMGEIRHEWPFMPFIWAVASVNPLSFGSHIGCAELLVVYTFFWFSFDLFWRYRLFFSF